MELQNWLRGGGGLVFLLKGELGGSLRPCLLGADVELAHITLHQTDTEHELPFRGQILLRHGGNCSSLSVIGAFDRGQVPSCNNLACLQTPAGPQGGEEHPSRTGARHKRRRGPRRRRLLEIGEPPSRCRTEVRGNRTDACVREV